MAEATFTFPQGFIWGTATSAHQVEGNNDNNNWTTWEQKGHIIDGSTAGRACDWWGGKWRHDFDRAADGNQNAHRLSIEWSRIQPEPNRWNENALDHYRQMLQGLNERGLIPMVTLHHFTHPIWLEERGGWENEDIVASFDRFVRKAVPALAEYCDLWCTINEPNVFAVSGYLLGTFPPGKKDLRAVYQVLVNMLKAHGAAYHAIHEIQPHASVGMAHHYRGFSPARQRSPFDRWAANVIFQSFNHAIPQTLQTGVFHFFGRKTQIPAVKDCQDFFGLNYYTREFVAFNIFTPGELFTRRFYDPGAELSPTGFIANEPEEFFQALKWANRFQLPIFVTENGIEDNIDTLRPKYIIQHIHQMWRGVNYTWPIKGYFHWSLVDNFEWERGWTQRFGLWELDCDTQERRKRKSADLYKAICKENAISSPTVREFAPDLAADMFPG